MPVDANLWNQAKQNEKVMQGTMPHVATIVGQVTMLVKSLHDYDIKIKAAAGTPKEGPLKANGKKELVALTGNFAKWPATSAMADKTIHATGDWIQKVTKAAKAAKDKNAETWAAGAGKTVLTSAAGLAQAKQAIAKFTGDFNGFKVNKNFL